MGMKAEVRTELTEHIIPFWKSMRDGEYGGFYGEMDGSLKINYKAEKGCILNSRILWFFSSAYLTLKDKSLLEDARQAYTFLADHFIDKIQGGLFWSVKNDGSVLDGTKHTYNQAFGIYALSAYYEASGEKKALETAWELFNIIEEKCRDENGYLEAFSRNWAPEVNYKLSENGVIAQRTMNTLLHVFEGYTGLYHAEKNDKLAQRLCFILELFQEKIFNQEKRRQDVFFDLKYNSLVDLHSYGHDIEASWLLEQGAYLLGNEKTAQSIYAVTDVLAEHVYEKAYHKDSLYNEMEKGKNDTTRIWWVQAEAVVGFINAYEKNPLKKHYMEAAEKIWGFIREKLVDKRRGGEWYWEVDDQGKPSENKNIADKWKCPYHNGRMCLEVLRRI